MSSLRRKRGRSVSPSPPGALTYVYSFVRTGLEDRVGMGLTFD